MKRKPIQIKIRGTHWLIISDLPMHPAMQQAIAGHALRHAGLTADRRYTVTLRAKRTGAFHGRGSYARQISKWNPHHPINYTDRDPRFAHGQRWLVKNRMQSLIFIIAHEAAHATSARPDRYTSANGRCNRVSMEFEANRIGLLAVDRWPCAWRKAGPIVAAAIQRSRRRQRMAACPARAKAQRIAQLAQRIKAWEIRLKRGATLLRKAQRQHQRLIKEAQL